MKHFITAGFLAAFLLCAPVHAQTCEDETALYSYQALIVSAYDADTFKAVLTIPQNDPISHYDYFVTKPITFRLLHVDAWEVRGSERAKGLMARDWFRARAVGKVVRMETDAETGKYGRLLATLCDEDGDIAVDMVAAGHAEFVDY